jgi:hypothetical protein
VAAHTIKASGTHTACPRRGRERGTGLNASVIRLQRSASAMVHSAFAVTHSRLPTAASQGSNLHLTNNGYSQHQQQQQQGGASQYSPNRSTIVRRGSATLDRLLQSSPSGTASPRYASPTHQHHQRRHSTSLAVCLQRELRGRAIEPRPETAESLKHLRLQGLTPHLSGKLTLGTRSRMCCKPCSGILLPCSRSSPT